MATPGETLSQLVRNYGWDSFTVEPIDPDTGVDYGCYDLGNGNMVYGFISQFLDNPRGTSGEGISSIDMMSCNLQDWDNLSSRFTGQYGAPDSMHDSEYLGVGMAEFAASNIGEYAMPYIEWECDNSCDCEGQQIFEGEYCEPDIEGWLFLHRNIF